MKCPKCGSEDMYLEEFYRYQESDTELKIEEHWWCNECDATPTRIVTYQQTKERWEE